jgi:hypothetical protein
VPASNTASTGSARPLSTTGEQIRRHGCIRGQAAETAPDENGKLKKLLADAMLDNAALKDLLSRNGDADWEARGGRAS